MQKSGCSFLRPIRGKETLCWTTFTAARPTCFPFIEEAKILYGLLLDRMGLSVKNGWMDDTGKVYIIFTTEEIMEALCCADNKATKLMKELEGCGLIERKRRGLGKPSLTYVKNFISEPSEPRIQSRENHDSGTVKNATAESLKSRGIKNNQNNTDLSDTDPFLSDVAAGTESEGKDDRTRYQDLSFRTWPPERNPKGKMTAPGIRIIFSRIWPRCSDESQSRR